MPSNALKISQFIEHLQGVAALHGDLDVIMAVPIDNTLVAIDGRNVNVAGELLGKQLPAPALVIGMWRDEAGRLRNSPGAVYAATADAGEWTYVREAAPEGADVAVWKRYGGHDIGRREGDNWFVREGAAAWPVRPVQIVPASILAWKPL